MHEVARAAGVGKGTLFHRFGDRNGLPTPRTSDRPWAARCRPIAAGPPPHGRAFRHHVTALLREAGVVGDHTMIAHALLAFVDLETLDHLRSDAQVTTGRLQTAWADLVRRVTSAEER
ncbi:TetR family transcriptional regulator [Streptomyces sp. DSM 15324]|uniref:TetR family transcriptional regulator n=1 Tax=Streptomyces sp. DSM 15324 TaxID=1739111 RepID=UPI001F3CD291